MKKRITVSVFTENRSGLLNRVSIIFTRRKINIESITASECEQEGIHRYTIVVRESEDLIRKVVGQLEKQVEVLKAFYHEDSELVFQDMALYKLAYSGKEKEVLLHKLLREHDARLLAMEEEYTVIEKTGSTQDIELLFKALAPFKVLEFARSGAVAITKPMKRFQEILNELELAQN